VRSIRSCPGRRFSRTEFFAARVALLAACVLGGACGEDSPEAAAPATRFASVASEPLALEQPLAYWPLTAAEIRSVYPLPQAGYLPDPLQGFKRKPSHEQRFVFAEHAGGGFLIRTNALSLREDAEPAAQRPDLRVLVAGDSHTDGACDNAESFANLLEADLGAADPRRAIEVLNAGMGSSSFYNYLGTFERLLSLEPHVFLVVVYGGNDWGEALAPWHHYHRSERPSAGGDYDARLDAGLAVHGGWGRQAISQSHNQYLYFQREPAQAELALRAALSVTAEIQRRCDAHGIEFCIAYLPPLVDVQRDVLQPHVDALDRALGLDADALAITERLAERYLAWCAAQRIRTLDLGPVLRAHANEPLYWLADLHLSVRGHQVVADALAAWFRGMRLESGSAIK
jgi:lysophospholipase L1-like esterase